MSLLWTLWLATLATAAEPITLEQVLEAAATAPEATLAQVDIALARAERQSSRAMSNPSVEYQGFARTRGTTDDINGQQHQIDVGFALPITGELAARVRRGTLAEALGESSATMRYALLGEALAAAWVELSASQERERAYADSSRRVTELLELTARRAEDGAARPWDVDRMRLAKQAIDRQWALARQERSEASAELAQLLGNTTAELEASGELRAALPLPSSSAQQEAPQVKHARAELAYREAALREARRSMLPEPELRLGGLFTTDGDSTSLVAGIGVELPIFDVGRGRIAAAKAEQQAAEAELQQTLALIEAERWAAQAASEALRETLEQDPVAAGKVSDAAEVAFREGELGILELVDSVSAEVDALLDSIDILVALRRAELRLALLDGRLTSTVSP